jgi:uncharacterized protein (DUF1330 family)
MSFAYSPFHLYCAVQELFLYSGGDGDEGYMHEASSNVNHRSPRSSSSAHTPSHSGALPASVRRNKQFQGYQTLMSSDLKRYGDVYTVQGGAGGGVKGRLQPDDTLVESWQVRHKREEREQREHRESGQSKQQTAESGGRKRKLIVLSDSEGEDDGTEERRRGENRRSRSHSALEGKHSAGLVAYFRSVKRLTVNFVA